MKKFIFIISMLMLCGFVHGESDNNDCFWYNRCFYNEFDIKGDPIENSKKFIYPNHDDCIFEIQFDYAPNYQTAEHPFTIYLNEVNGESGRIVKKKLGSVIRRLKSSVTYYADRVNIFIEGYQISVVAKGQVLIYEIAPGTIYKNARLFPPINFQEPIYETRYKMLLEKLKSIKWG